MRTTRELIDALRAGEVVDLDGIKLSKDGDGQVGPGDFMLGELGGKPTLMMCENVIDGRIYPDDVSKTYLPENALHVRRVK